MAESLEAMEARVDRQTTLLIEAQDVWDARVRAGDDDTEALMDTAAQIAWVRSELRSIRAGLAQLAEQERVREERKRRQVTAELLNTRFTDKQVLADLKRALKACSVGATGAGTIARSLAARPTQSDRIRVGLALSRLAAQGKVVRLVAGDGRTAHVWSLPGVTVADWIYKTHHAEKGGDK
jgi:hypothetical protein